MLQMLGAAANNTLTIVVFVVLIVLLIVYMVFGTINRKKQQDQAMKMLNELKKGDKVVTNAGIYGEIVSQRETNMGKVVVLKTGEDGGKASYLTVNASVILGIDTKQDLILDAQGNVIEPEKAKEEVLKPATEKVEEQTEEVEKTKEEAKEEKKEEATEKKTAKKSANKTEAKEKTSVRPRKVKTAKAN